MVLLLADLLEMIFSVLARSAWIALMVLSYSPWQETCVTR